jgi:hypothetical protein
LIQFKKSNRLSCKDIHKIGRQACNTLWYTRVGHKVTSYVETNLPEEDTAPLLGVELNRMMNCLGFKKGGTLNLRKMEINFKSLRDNRM